MPTLSSELSPAPPLPLAPPSLSVAISAASTSAYVSVAALDSTHFVVAYENTSVSNLANAVVSTVSGGTTITPGTPVALNADSSTYESVAALDSTHFVVAYVDNSTTYANAVVSTVSSPHFSH